MICKHCGSTDFTYSLDCTVTVTVRPTSSRPHKPVLTLHDKDRVLTCHYCGLDSGNAAWKHHMGDIKEQYEQELQRYEFKAWVKDLKQQEERDHRRELKRTAEEWERKAYNRIRLGE